MITSTKLYVSVNSLYIDDVIKFLANKYLKEQFLGTNIDLK